MDKVAINKCDKYDVDEITDILYTQFDALGINLNEFNGKNILIKPNLLTKRSPDKATTTNPALVEAVCGIVMKSGGKLTIADSPAGAYSQTILKGLYKTCGMTEAAERTGAVLNYDVSYNEVRNPNGYTSKVFNFLTPVCNADYIINICKLKTHSYTTLSAAVKNFFGCIPGTQKFEIHSRFKKRKDFFSMLTDLCKNICDTKTVLNITDAVVGMEGNGPSGGSPRHIGCILSSANPFTLDLVHEKLVNLNEVPTVEISRQRGYCPKSVSDVEIIGDDINELIIKDFKKPDAVVRKVFDLVPAFLSPRPVIDNDKCAACLDCVKSCPVNTIELINNKAFIHREKCIKCYCCQELCKFKAIKIKKNIIYKIFK
jgi:Uncharacterized conserved protein